MNETGYQPLLHVKNLSAFYGELRAITGITMSIEAGSVVSIIGANGAGKSTLMKSIVGLMTRGSAAHTTGQIEFRGEQIHGMDCDAIVDRGVAMVPEGRRLFARMTVEDNLLMGGYLRRCRPNARRILEEIYTLFPRLGERRKQVVAEMSGGEQQMVAIGRALMSNPSLVLFDELSLGLAPVVIEEIYRRVRSINEKGTTCVIIEQDMKRALGVADYVYVMLEGRVLLHGRPADLSEDEVVAAYFGSHVHGHHLVDGTE
ncbi:ABC transporter ATP-binding protein [Paraburkholderia sp. JHI869]|uniref:ABC transporter ATP-binding protein n=1 Tax=Paraburkholderia sp. JHI869 TaxID=3112959 RepID=UPI003179B99C